MVKAPKASAFGAFCIVLNENCEGKSAAESGLFRRNTGFTAAHGEDGLFHQFLQRPAKTLSAGLDHVTGAAGGELLVLVLLFQTADLHVHARSCWGASGRLHRSGRSARRRQRESSPFCDAPAPRHSTGRSRGSRRREPVLRTGIRSHASSAGALMQCSSG